MDRAHFARGESLNPERTVWGMGYLGTGRDVDTDARITTILPHHAHVPSQSVSISVLFQARTSPTFPFLATAVRRPFYRRASVSASCDLCFRFVDWASSPHSRPRLNPLWANPSVIIGGARIGQVHTQQRVSMAC